MTRGITSTPQREEPKEGRLTLFTLATLYSATIAMAIFTLQPSSRRPTSLDYTLKPFNFGPIPLEEYGDRFNRALDDGSLMAGKLTLAERIAINQRMREASYHYIGNDSAILHAIPLEELMAMATSGVGHHPPMGRRQRGRGKYSLLLVGNSHAAMVEKDLRKEWRSRYSTFDSFLATCLPLELNYLTGWRRAAYGTRKACDIFPAAVLKLVEKVKPDLLFITFRWDNDIYPNPPPVTWPIEKDRVFLGLQSAISSLEASVQRRIFIGAPNLHFPFPATHHELAKRLWLNSSLDSLNLDLKAHAFRTHPNWARLRQLRCEKCVVVDWSEAFCTATGRSRRASNESEEGVHGEGGVCLGYDPLSQLAYFIDEHHYSYLGCRQIRPLLRRLAEAI